MTYKAIVGIFVCVKPTDMEERYKKMGSLEGLRCVACLIKECFFLSWMKWVLISCGTSTYR